MTSSHQMIPTGTPDNKCEFCSSTIEDKFNYTVCVHCIYPKEPKTTKYEPTYGHVTSCSNCEEAQAPINSWVVLVFISVCVKFVPSIVSEIGIFK